MKKKQISSLILFFGILTIVTFVVLFFVFENFEKENVAPKPTPEVLSFLEAYNYINFSHPYLACIFQNTCNGTFELSLYSDLDNDISLIENLMNSSGTIRNIDTADNSYRIDFETDNIYKIDPLLKSKLFSNIVLLRVRSDYKLGILDEELHSCEQDDDCVIINEDDCLPSPDIINRKYQTEVENLFAISHQGGICPDFWSSNIYQFAKAKCYDKECSFMLDEDRLCSLIYAECKYSAEEYKDENIFPDYNLSCNELEDMCAGYY